MKILWIGFEKQLGIEKTHKVLKMNKGNWNLEKIIQFNPELIIEREFNDGISLYQKEMEQFIQLIPNAKRAMWFIDTHVQYQRHKDYQKWFDYRFFAISKYAQEFGGYWLPLCYPAPEIVSYDIKPIHKMGFIGRRGRYFNERNKVLSFLKYFYEDDFYIKTDYETVYKSMAECKIIVNRSIGKDMNYRVFEALGTGNILVTNEVPDLYKIEGLTDRIYIYKSFCDLINIIERLLKTDISADMIQNNIEYTKLYHMLPNRINSMLKIIETKKQVSF